MRTRIQLPKNCGRLKTNPTLRFFCFFGCHHTRWFRNHKQTKWWTGPNAMRRWKWPVDNLVKWLVARHQVQKGRKWESDGIKYWLRQKQSHRSKSMAYEVGFERSTSFWREKNNKKMKGWYSQRRGAGEGHWPMSRTRWSLAIVPLN